MKINHYERKSYININSNDRVKNNIITRKKPSFRKNFPENL